MRFKEPLVAFGNEDLSVLLITHIYSSLSLCRQRLYGLINFEVCQECALPREPHGHLVPHDAHLLHLPPMCLPPVLVLLPLPYVSFMHDLLPLPHQLHLEVSTGAPHG